MEENKQHIDELFREALSSYTETPPPAVWETVESRLAGTGRRPSPSLLRWWGWFALLLITVGGGAIIYKFRSGRNTTGNSATTTYAPTSQRAEKRENDAADFKYKAGIAPDKNNDAAAEPAKGRIHHDEAATTPVYVAKSGARIAAPTSDHSTQSPARATPGRKAGSRSVSPLSGDRNDIAAPEKVFTKKPVAAQKPADREKDFTPKNPSVVEPSKAAVSSQSVAVSKGDDLPASLQGKNMSVNFPTVRKVVPVIAKAPPRAPDVSMNPAKPEQNITVAAEQANPVRVEEPMQYTINKHRESSAPGIKAGIGAGFSFGLSKPTPAEVLISPYLEFKLSDKLGLRVSPTYRFGNVNTQLATGNFFRDNATSLQHTSRYDSITFTTHYTYFLSQNYDSVRTANSYGGHTWAFDLPVTLAYRLGAGFSIFGGPVFSFQNTISALFSSQTYGRSRFDSVTSTSPLDTAGLLSAYHHRASSQDNLGSYAGGIFFRMGYLAGLRYAYRRWQAELSVQQNVTGINNISNSDVKRVYSQPYIRLSIGFDLWKPKKKKVEAP